MSRSETMEHIARILAEKTRDRFATIHIDAAGLIRLGETNDERLNNFERILTTAESLGGNFAVPVFSYSYGKNEVFNILETPSTVGRVTEYLRKRRPHRRTVDPFFSFLLYGNVGMAHCLVRDYECFGDQSLFAELHQLDGYVCCIGNVFYNIPTEVHYFERKLGVDYRFNKEFSGTLVDVDGHPHPQKAVYFCRKDPNSLEADFTRLERDLLANCLFEYWRAEEVEFEIQAISMQRLFAFIQTKVAGNPHYLCSPVDAYLENKKRRKLGII
ncbi:MAG TPA: AAC(3) family N-acetyltransferase [Candidatus Ozemobacteraceae bacterium]